MVDAGFEGELLRKLESAVAVYIRVVFPCRYTPLYEQKIIRHTRAEFRPVEVTTYLPKLPMAGNETSGVESGATLGASLLLVAAPAPRIDHHAASKQVFGTSLSQKNGKPKPRNTPLNCNSASATVLRDRTPCGTPQRTPENVACLAPACPTRTCMPECGIDVCDTGELG